jgi:hypothetical protein
VQPQPGSWSGSLWQQYHGMTPMSQVAAETNGDGRVALYGVTPTGSVYHRVQSAAGNWTGSAWAQVDGTLRTTRPIVPPAVPTVANPGTPTALLNSAFALNTGATGGTAPYTWAAGGLPAGLSINGSNGQISGTPAAAGTFTVTLTATDSSNPRLASTTTFPLTVLVAVPDIVGLDRIDANGALGNVNLNLGNERDVVIMDCGNDIGHITAQSPAPGTPVPVWTSVNFDVGVKPSGNYHCY